MTATPLAASVDPLRVVVWSLVLLAAVLAGFVLVQWLRNRLMKTDDRPSEGFTLSDLRRLHKAGQISDAEYEKAKAALVVGLQARLRREEEERKAREEQQERS